MVQVGETISCLYNTARFGLTHLEQSMPAAHVTALKIQNIVCFLDIVDLCFKAEQVYTQLKHKYSQHKDKINGLALLAIPGLIGASYVFSKTMSRYSVPSIDLQACLKNIIPAEDLKNVSWTRPMLYEAIQCIFFARIVLNLVSAAISPKPYLQLVNSALQMGSLYKMSQMQWIQLEQAIDSPLFQETVKKIKTTFCVRIFSTDESSLKSTIESIYSLNHQMFKDSTWSRFWARPGGLGPFNTEDYSSQLSVPTYWQALKNLFKQHVMGTPQLQYEAKLTPTVWDKISALNFTFIKARVWHTDNKWQPFQLMDRIAKRFFVPGHIMEYSAWIPLTLK